MVARKTESRLTAVHKAVFGNGKPEQCILVRIKRIERKMCMLEKLSWAILCGVIAVVAKLVGIWGSS